MSFTKMANTKIANISSNFTNILEIGGSYAAISFIDNFITMIQGENALPLQTNGRKFSITMIEPKSGFLNVIGMPRAILDVEFAKSQYIAFNKLKGIEFDNMFESENVSKRATTNIKIGLELNYIQGKVTKLDSKSAEYEMEMVPQATSLQFNYVVLASGRNRSPPISPESLDENSFINEASDFKRKVEISDKISIIGAGAVGIEVAAEIKHYHPEKTVNLIHPYLLFPPEPLSSKFKESAHASLKDAGVNIVLETRIDKELANGNLETDDGKTIESQFNYWTSGKKNNISMLAKNMQDKYVSKSGNLLTNEYLQLCNSKDIIKNIFCIGDIVELPVIKTAGWANQMGIICAANISSLLNNKQAEKTLPKDKLETQNMVLVSGNRDLISEVDGQVEINKDRFVEEYKDYCLSKVKRKLHV